MTYKIILNAADVWNVCRSDESCFKRRAYYETDDERRAESIAEGLNNRVFVFDNGGQTIDRYTVCIVDEAEESVDVHGASENPFFGFGQYSHTSDDVQGTLQRFRDDETQTELAVKDCTFDVIRFIIQRV